MAKDNQRKPSDPGKAGTTKGKTSQVKRPIGRSRWKKIHWVSFAQENGIEDAENMSLSVIRSHVKKLTKEGKIENRNGGAREGAGRKPINVLECVKTAQELIADHATEEIEMLIKDPNNPGEAKTKKMTRVEALMTRLFMEGSRGNVSAATSYLDRFMGRPKQAIEHSGEIKTEEQEIPTPAEIAAAAAYEKALEEGKPVLSPLSK